MWVGGQALPVAVGGCCVCGSCALLRCTAAQSTGCWRGHLLAFPAVLLCSLPAPCPPLHRLVPIVYTSEVSWQQELWRLLPTILLIGGYVWFTRRQMGGLGGGGGPGGRGIFNVGKASVRGCLLGCRAAQFMAGPGRVECRWLCRKRRQAALAGRWTGLLPHF